MIDLNCISKKIRKSVVKMAHCSCASHTGSALSIVDILTVLYFKVLNIDPNNVEDMKRDRFILSKGHSSAALYATLAERGFFDRKYLDKYYCDGGILPGHVDMTTIPGLEASAGSLGHGLSIGTGIALAMRKDKMENHIYVLIGDGELNEGSVWEAIMFIPHIGLRNLTLIVDYNKLQGYGRSDNVLKLTPFREKFMSFGWSVLEVDGHDFLALEKAMFQKTEYPKVIIADTVKGKGVGFMEDNFLWHYKSPDDEELKIALKELS